MKHIKTKISFLLISFAIMSAFFASCGGDSTTSTSSSAGWPPVFSFTSGQKFVYTNDSLTTSGVDIRLHRGSTDVATGPTTFSGQTCYQFLGATTDSTVPPKVTPDLYYVYYDASGRYYQYGIKKLIDTSQVATWDLIGDFTVSRGTVYSVGTVTYNIQIPGYPTPITFTGPLTGQIADSTIIQTTLSGETIYCYRIELHANLTGQGITTDVYLEYFVGYSNSPSPTNPVGLVELTLKPFAFKIGSAQLLSEPGYDRKLYSHQP